MFKFHILIYLIGLVKDSNHVLFFSLSDVEESQLSECGGEEELGGRETPLPRSSSTSDITQQLSDTLEGIHRHKKTVLPLRIFQLCPDWNYIISIIYLF